MLYGFLYYFNHGNFYGCNIMNYFKKKNMSLLYWSKKIALFHAFMLICCVCLAKDSLFKQARTLQREGKYEEAIEAFKNYLTQPVPGNELSD